MSLFKNKMLISWKMPPKEVIISFVRVAIRTMVECMSCPLWPTIAPPNIFFLFVKEFVKDCAILLYLWIAQSPFLFLFYFEAQQADPT
jgi:hypothetical protein